MERKDIKVSPLIPQLTQGDFSAMKLRYRIRRPVKGAIYRYHDVGSKGHTIRLARYNPRTKKWATQTWIFPIEDIRTKRPKTMKMLADLGIKRKALRMVI